MHPGNRVVNNNEKRNYLSVETVKKKDLKFQINNDHWIFQYLTNYSRHVGVSNNCQLLNHRRGEGKKKRKKRKTFKLTLSRYRGNCARVSSSRARRWTYINRFLNEQHMREEARHMMSDFAFDPRLSTRRKSGNSWKLGSHDLYRLYFYVAFLYRNFFYDTWKKR